MTRSSFGELYPFYFRGLAYRAAHRPADAAAEFQRVLDHPGMTLNDSVGTAARLQLARVWVDLSDKTKARGVYRELLKLWEKADSAMPVLQQAKDEFGRL